MGASGASARRTMNVRNYFCLIPLYTETSANGAAVVPPGALSTIIPHLLSVFNSPKAKSRPGVGAASAVECTGCYFFTSISVVLATSGDDMASRKLDHLFLLIAVKEHLTLIG